VQPSGYQFELVANCPYVVIVRLRCGGSCSVGWLRSAASRTLTRRSQHIAVCDAGGRGIPVGVAWSRGVGFGFGSASFKLVLVAGDAMCLPVSAVAGGSCVLGPNVCAAAIASFASTRARSSVPEHEVRTIAA